MQPGQSVLVRTDPGAQFLGALAQNAALTANLAMGSAIGQVDAALAAGKTLKGVCRSIVVASTENLAWEVSLWGSSAFNGTPGDFATYTLLGKHAFVVGDGLQIAGAGPYLYEADNLYFPVVDLDRAGQLHVMLVNRSASGKSGPILLQFAIDPAYGQ